MEVIVDSLRTEPDVRAVRLFDLRHTFESAQPLTFRADYDFGDNSVFYTADNNAVKVRAAGTPLRASISVFGGGRHAAAEAAKRFRLDDDMQKIYRKIDTDRFMNRAISAYPGMRLTLNDPWETTLCFIISQYNNVKRIRKIVRAIVQRYGNDVLGSDGKPVAKSFPGSADLIGASVRDFLACGAGFRARYIKEAAEYCTDNLDLNKLNPKRYDRLKETLMEITGVGDKVADCIALMGYGSLDAFPIDVWVKRTVERVYFKGRERSVKQIHEFAEDRWPHAAGYAQQYIFWHGRQMDEEMTRQLV